MAKKSLEKCETLVSDMVDRLNNKKGLDIVVIDLAGRSGFADFFVIATGTSTTHVSTLANEMMALAHERKINVRGIEGMTECSWVLIDLGDVLIHVFLQEVREFYNLEKLWSKEARSKHEEKMSVQVEE